jgi:hypothetical protein
MKRLALLVLALLLAVPAAASARPRVALTECVSAVSQAERTAGFEARMKTNRPTFRLQMRFTLQSRDGLGDRWQRLDAPGWGQWHAADPATTSYAYEKRVENLAAPGEYRAVVRFRWLAATGKVLRVTRAASPVCRQPEPRPNLRPLALVLEDGHYRLSIGNLGRSSTGAFEVALTVNGAAQDPAHVQALGPRSRTEVAIAGPRCVPGGEITATVDSEMVVDESDELDNVYSVTCPAG